MTSRARVHELDPATGKLIRCHTWMSFPVIWLMSRPGIPETLFFDFILDEFSRNWLAWCPKILKFKIGWVIQQCGLAHALQESTDRNRSVRFGPRTGPGPKKIEKSRTDSDQDRVYLKKLGPNRTRIKYFQKITDRTGPGPSKFRKSRTELDQDQQNLENLGPKRTRTNNIWKISDQVGPIGPRTRRSVDPCLSQDRDIFAWNSLSTKYKGNHSVTELNDFPYI